MRAARYYGNRDIRLDEINAPTPDRGEVLIDVAACGICGSDLHIYKNGEDRYEESDLPSTIGHEVGGTVVNTGEDVEIEEGTDVVVNPHIACEECWCCEKGMYNLCRNLSPTAVSPGGFTEQIVAPVENLIPVPAGVSPEVAATAQPLSVALHAVRKSPVGLGDSVAVVGAGPIGLGVVGFAKSAGAGPIYVSEPRQSRRSIAEEFGGDVVIDPTEENPVELIREDTGMGVDVAFEAVGHETTMNQAIKAAKPGGHTKVIGVFDGDANIDPQDLVRHERTVSGSTSHQIGPLAKDEYGTTLRQIATGALDSDRYVTSRIDLSDIVEEGFERLVNGAEDEVKILVRP